jgi:hypothetical protein
LGYLGLNSKSLLDEGTAMGNGFLVVDDKDWADATSDQRSWMTYKTLKSLHDRQKEMETSIEGLKRRPWADKACAVLGGIIGGILTAVGIKIGG